MPNSTLNIVNNEIKYKAKVVKAYGDIPRAWCLPYQLNQVFMNLLVNSAHAIETEGTITVRTVITDTKQPDNPVDYACPRLNRLPLTISPRLFVTTARPS